MDRDSRALDRLACWKVSGPVPVGRPIGKRKSGTGPGEACPYYGRVKPILSSFFFPYAKSVVHWSMLLNPAFR